MAVLFRVFFMTLLSLSALMIISLLLSLFGSKPSYLQQSLSKLRLQLEGMIEELIPLDIQEFKILSWKQLKNKTKKGVQSGYLSTIFQEKVFAYALTEKVDECVLEVSSADKSYTLHTDGSNTKVFLSDVQLGTIQSNIDFFTIESNNSVIKAIHMGGGNYSIRVDEAEHLDIFLGLGDYSNDRVFKMVHKPQLLKDDAFVSLLLFLLLIKAK